MILERRIQELEDPGAKQSNWTFDTQAKDLGEGRRGRACGFGVLEDVELPAKTLISYQQLYLALMIYLTLISDSIRDSIGDPRRR